MVKSTNIPKLANVLKLLGNQTRIEILLYLTQHGPQHVTAISEALTIHQSALSQQLKTLKLSGLLTAKREGQKIVYAIDNPYSSQFIDSGINLINLGSNHKLSKERGRFYETHSHVLPNQSSST